MHMHDTRMRFTQDLVDALVQGHRPATTGQNPSTGIRRLHPFLFSLFLSAAVLSLCDVVDSGFFDKPQLQPADYVWLV